jgi:pSer/pThr/pTyr-binding forkhead associated (FHA) protein
MEVSLEITSGPQAGETFPLRSNRQVQIGRGPDPEISVSTDPLVSELHFAFWWDEGGCRIEDLRSTRGTLLNGQKINQAAVHNGDKIVAGQTQFIVRIKPDPGMPEVAPISERRGVAVQEQDRRPVAESTRAKDQPAQFDDLLEILRSQPQPLFAILDAARDPKVLETLRKSDQRYQSLYEGAKGEELAECAPYLVELPSESALIETLVRDGWGKSWGIFLTSTGSFKEIRRHFRRFLLVQTEDGRELYFRFYDPRVLRIFLPTGDSRQALEVFGPVSLYLMESVHLKSLLRFSLSPKGVALQELPISANAPSPAVLNRS